MTSGARRSPVSDPHLLTRRSFLAGAAAAGIGVAAYAGTHGRHELEVVPRSFAIANLPDAFQGFRIAQLSDIHLEEFTEAWFLEEAVRRTNALQPDLVLLTGDFVSRGPESWPHAWRAAGVCAEILSGLNAPLRYAVLGNHDVAVGPSHVIDPLQAHGTPFLVNDHILIERGGDRLWICGLNDVEGSFVDMSAAIPADPHGAVIFMVHEPDFVERVIEHPRFPLIDLMLSGHSHGGQICLPWVGPLILPPLGKKYPVGLYRFGRMQMYVNRGIGTVGVPLRLNCPAEITHITLMRA